MRSLRAKVNRRHAPARLDLASIPAFSGAGKPLLAEKILLLRALSVITPAMERWTANKTGNGPEKLRLIQVVNVRWVNATAWYALFLARLLKEAGHQVLTLGL
jgi:hypothetical protein